MPNNFIQYRDSSKTGRVNDEQSAEFGDIKKKLSEMYVELPYLIYKADIY